MAIDPKTFSVDNILTHLVDYFNAQPIESRTIRTSDFPIFRSVVTSSPDTLEPTYTLNPDPYSEITGTYIGEATFVWVGDRGIGVTATNQSFFEISKYISAVAEGVVGVNLRSYGGYIQWESPTGWANLVSLEELQGPMGKSAYLEALDAGFVGTVEEWLESLKGEDAYTLALQAGYVGTFEEWARDMAAPIILETDAFKFLSNDGVNAFWTELTIETLTVQEYIDQSINDAIDALSASFVTHTELPGEVEGIVNNMTIDSGELL